MKHLVQRLLIVQLHHRMLSVKQNMFCVSVLAELRAYIIEKTCVYLGEGIFLRTLQMIWLFRIRQFLQKHDKENVQLTVGKV